MIRKDDNKAAAWLSSARTVRCSLKWGNERNPYPVLEMSRGTVPIFYREGRRGRRQVSTALMPWATHILQWRITMRCKKATSSQSLKFRLSWDWSLQFDSMNTESVVIANQQVAVNTFSGLAHTARQANKVGGSRSSSLLRNEAKLGDGD